MNKNDYSRTQYVERLAKPRILIADDTASSRELLRSILEDCGYEVAELVDENNILERSLTFEPHLIILDLQMSKLDGCETATLLRQHRSFRKTPMIALTAAASEVSADHISKSGFNLYIVKPISPARLRRSVARLL